jgi:hypothetical protein
MAPFDTAGKVLGACFRGLAIFIFSPVGHAYTIPRRRGTG